MKPQKFQCNVNTNTMIAMQLELQRTLTQKQQVKYRAEILILMNYFFRLLKGILSKTLLFSLNTIRKKQIHLLQRKTAQAMGKYLKLQQLQMSQNQIEQEDKEFKKKQEKQIIVIKDQLIYNEIQNLYQQDTTAFQASKKQNKQIYKLSLEGGTLLFLDNNQIFIYASKQKTLKIIKTIETLKLKLKANKVQTIVMVNEKEMNFIQKKFNQKIDEALKQNKIFSIDYERLKTEPQKTFIIDINGKQLIIMYGNIANISCNAIVNSCNNKICFEDHRQLSGVAQSIMKMAGIKNMFFYLQIVFCFLQ